MAERIETSALVMSWSEAPWDEAVCGFPVLQITDVAVHDAAGAANDIGDFERQRDRLGVGLVSCRLSHEKLRESMLLEDRGFRFIEMTYQPSIELASFRDDGRIARLEIAEATEADLPVLLDIAGTAFANERFKVDHRLDASISDKRYRNWVASTPGHATQRLHVLRDDGAAVAFFVSETLADGTCYWHLNAVAPAAQGRGLGCRAWFSMMAHAFEGGAQKVRSSIVARNHRVLNLYARLGFSFSPPQMTFHWVRQA